MARTKIDLDEQAVGRLFTFGSTAASDQALVTIEKGTAPTSTVVLDVKGSANIGGDLVIGGNFTYNGTINNQSVTNLDVTDLVIRMNNGGATPADNTSGIVVEGTGDTIATALYFNSVSNTKWSLSTGGDLVGTTATQTLTNKSISGSQITSAVANATLAATVTTNANLTGPITSVGNATSVANQTGTGSVFVMNTSPTLVTPNIGAANGASLSVTGSVSVGTASSVAGDVVWRNATSAFTQTFRGSDPSASIVYVLPTTAPAAGQFLSASAPAAGISTMSWSNAGTGSVTSVSVTTANGISGTVTNPTSTPAISLTLGAITPTSVNGITLSGSSTPTLAVTGTSSISGANTGDQTTITGNAGSATNIGITNDTTTNATMFPVWVTANTGNLPAKVTSTKLSFNPSTGVLTSTSFTGSGAGLTGTASSLTAGTVTTNANLTGMVTSVGNATTVVTNANLTGDVTSVGNATTLAIYFKAAVVTGTQDAANKVFTIGAAVKAGSEQVFHNGQLLTPGASNDYVISGTTITFQAGFTAPKATAVIRVYGVY